jgi:uncharacterized membrane protein YqaE (UPF0057 family)
MICYKMNRRIFFMVLVLLLGVWHVALAFSPGGEEKGGKTRDKQELVNRAAPHGERMASDRFADELKGPSVSDQHGAEAPLTYRPATTIPTTPSLAVVLENRRVEQAAVISRKQVREAIKSQIRANRKQGQNLDRPAAPFADDMLIICVLLAILFPPLGVAIWEEGITSHFWIALLLTLFFYIPGLIYAIYIITK